MKKFRLPKKQASDAPSASANEHLIQQVSHFLASKNLQRRQLFILFYVRL